MDESPTAKSPNAVYRPGLLWQLGMSSYWFATSFKWFILFFLLSGQIDAIVPDGEKNKQWGFVVMVGALWAMVGPGLFGYLSDRCRSRFGRRRPFIAIGGALTAVALVFMGAANQMWMFVLAYLILQISDDIGTGPYSALIPDYVPEDERGRAAGIMGLLKLAAQIGAAVTGLILGGNVMMIYIVIAIINILAAIWVLVTVKEPPYAFDSPANRVNIGQALRGMFKPFRRPDFRWIWLTSFLNAFGFYLILVYMRNYLKDSVLDIQGLTEKEADAKILMHAIILAVIISLTGALASIIAGKLADRVGRKKIIFWSGVIMFATLVPFALIPNYTMMQVLAMFFGIGYGAYLSSDWALVSDVMESDENFGRDMGLWQMSVATPQVISGSLGLLIDFINDRTEPNHYGYTVVFFIASFGFLFGSTLIKRVQGST